MNDSIPYLLESIILPMKPAPFIALTNKILMPICFFVSDLGDLIPLDRR